MGYRDKYADVIESQFYSLENRIIEDIVRRIRKTGKITPTADMQINKLSELGYSSDDIESTIKKTLNASYPEMFELYDNVIEQEYTRNKKLYEQINGNFVPFEENVSLQEWIETARKHTEGELKNITKTMGVVEHINGQYTFLPLTEFYKRTLDAAVLDISSGAFDYNSVLKRVVNTLSNSGIRNIDYASGRSSRIAVAARRAVMTGTSQLAGQISDMNAKKLGTEYFEVSYHGGARPSHRRWQGKVYTRDELVSVCGLGKVDGLKGANCYHDYYPFIPGVSERRYSDKWLKEQNEKEDRPKTFKGKKYTAYKARQKQREMETSMRAQRQKVKGLKTGGADREDIVIAQARYQGQIQEYKQFSEAMGLKPQMERVYIDGLGRVGASLKNSDPVVAQSPLIKDTALAKDGKAFQNILKQSKGDKKHINKMRLYAEVTEYTENPNLLVPFSYNVKTDKIEFNSKHNQFNRYDKNFAQAHEISHRMDILEYQAYKNKEFKNAIEDAKKYVKDHQEEIEKLFVERGKYYNDFAFSDIISALSNNAIKVPVGHTSWNDTKIRQEIFANLSAIDALGARSAQEQVIRELLKAYKKVVE